MGFKHLIFPNELTAPNKYEKMFYSENELCLQKLQNKDWGKLFYNWNEITDSIPQFHGQCISTASDAARKSGELSWPEEKMMRP